MNHSNWILSLSILLLTGFQAEAQHDHNHHDHGTKTVIAKPAVAEGVTDIIFVYGNCGMCENRIESSLANIKGVHSADWDVDTQVLTVNYNDDVISKDGIKEIVAKSGHDTDEFRADSEVYESLPGCCQYERPEK